MALLLLALCPAHSLAQLIPDSTLGPESSVVTPVAPQLQQIEGGAIRGGNLFHSFQEFNVAPAEQVYFVNPDAIAHILTRVTGGNPSDIFGTLGVWGTANLWLINPSGIYFGPDAHLDVRGNFTATTAAGVWLGEEALFSATDPSASPLLNIAPSALFHQQLAAQTPALLRSDAALHLPGNLTLAGDRVLIHNRLQADGTLRLWGFTTVTAQDSLPTPVILSAQQDLEIIGQQAIDLALLGHPDSVVRAGHNLTLQSEGAIVGDAHYQAGGTFQVLTLDGRPTAFWSPTDPVIQAAGDVTFGSYTGASLHLWAGGQVQVTGDITITGVDTVFGHQETVTLSDGTPLNIAGNLRPTLDIRAGTTALGTPGTGGTGTFSLTPPTLGTATASGIAIAGNIEILPPDGLVFLSTQVAPHPQLSGGDITVGAIALNGTATQSPGAIVIDARRDLSANGELNVAVSEPGDIAAVGQIHLRAGRDLTLDGVVTASAFSDSGQAAVGGEIRAAAGRHLTANDAIEAWSLSNTGQAADGGQIELSAGEQLTVKGKLEGYSTAFQGQTAQGGRVALTAGDAIVTQQEINVSTFSEWGDVGRGGQIVVSSGGTIHHQALLNAQALTLQGSAGDGGTIALSTAGTIATNRLKAGSITLGQHQTAGTAGSVTMQAGRDLLNQGAIELASFAFRGTAGNGGSLRLQAGGNVTNRGAITVVSSTAQGGDSANGGAIVMTAGQNLINEQVLDAQTYTRQGTTGNGGAIALTAGQNLTNRQALQSWAINQQGDTGSGGEQILVAGGTLLTQGPVSASTWSGAGRVGSGGRLVFQAGQDIITEQAVGTLSLAPNGESTQGGELVMSAGRDILLGGNLSTFAYANQGNAGSGGAIALTAGRNLQGRDRIALQTFTLAEQGNTLGDGGAIALTAGSQVANLTLTTISPQGQSGSVQISGTGNLTIANTEVVTTAQVAISNPRTGQPLRFTQTNVGPSGDFIATSQGQLTFINSQVISNTQTAFPAGRIQLSSPGAITLQGTILETNTTGTGSAGQIDITAQELRLAAASRLETKTAQSGQAGDIQLQIAEQVTLVESAIAASTEPFSTGRGGSIRVQSGRIQLDRAQITVDSQGQAEAGNIAIAGNTLTLTQQSAINAESVASQGGNITLNLRDYLLLRQGSRISTTAGIAGAGGDGGNIAIATPFLIAVPAENSDITANAFTGAGGQIAITAAQIYGLAFRNTLTPWSDITASSTLGINGVTVFERTRFPAEQGLNPVPLSLVSAADALNRDVCAVDQGQIAGGSSFIVTGRGGLPLSPDDVPTRTIAIPWATLPTRDTPARPIPTPPEAPRQAQGWWQDDQGVVHLYAIAPDSPLLLVNCRHAQLSSTDPSNPEP